MRGGWGPVTMGGNTIMRWNVLGTVVLSGILSAGAMSCASQHSDLPQKAMPANATFTGSWLTNFGVMKITQKDDGTVFGTFDYKTGGQVEGTVTGGVMQFQWIQPGDFQVGRREVSGHGYLVISDDGTEVEGEWGYADKYMGGGKWTGHRTEGGH